MRTASNEKPESDIYGEDTNLPSQGRTRRAAQGGSAVGAQRRRVGSRCDPHARLCLDRKPLVRLPSGTANRSVPPLNTIPFTTSPDEARGSSFCRQLGVDRPRAVPGTLHAQAREQWDLLQGAGAKLHSSAPVVIETFTFLDRNANRMSRWPWREAMCKPGTMKILPYEREPV